MKESYRRTLNDIDFILSQIEENERNKIPLKMRKFIHDNKLENYTPNISIDIPIENQELHTDTKAFLAMLYINYWCKDEQEKKELIAKLDENEKKRQKEIEEKYSIEKIFETRQQEQCERIEENHEEQQLVPYKESFVKKIWNRIIGFLRRNRHE